MATMRIPTEFIAIDKFSSVINKMTSGVGKFTDSTSASIDRFNSKANKVAGNMAIAGGAIVGAFGLAVNRAVEFEDKMADISKTTGLKDNALVKFGDELIDLSKKTRTSVADLQEIATIGGQLGVGEKDLMNFTTAANKFNVALGGDYAGGLESAVLSVGKLNSLYADTNSLAIDEHLNRAGSAFNALSSSGKSSSENINDFASRVGTLPGALKPSFVATAGLGAFLEEVGINSERGASGFSTLMLTAAKNLPAFAKQMGIGVKEAKLLIEQDPTSFAQKFSRSLNKLSPDQLAEKLNDLKIGGQESIKVIGALGTESNRLAEIIKISGESFAGATSLQDEYNTKNETTAAKLEIAKNKLEAFSITLGSQLLPMISQVTDAIAPLIEKVIDWIKANPKITKGVALFGVALLALSGTIKVFTIIMTAVKYALVAWNFVVATFNGTTWLATAAQWAWNAAMTANPIGLIIVGVAALIGFIALVISKWDEWGAAVAIFMGPLGLVISLIMSFRKHWDSVVEAFQTDGILGGIKRIGVVLIDAVLMPVQQLLEMLAKIPGLADLATAGADKIAEIRTNLELIPAPETSQAKNMNEMGVNGNIGININDKGGNVGSVKSSFADGITPKVTTTQGAF